MDLKNTMPNGEVQGDSTKMGDAGYMTGVDDTYGVDLSGDATNCEGGIGSDTKSDKGGFA